MHFPSTGSEFGLGHGSAAATAAGYRGIWYAVTMGTNEHKYSGGLGFYPQQMIPMAIYVAAVDRTFFCYGGASPDGKQLENRIGFFDHRTGELSLPTLVRTRILNDAHYNPSMCMDRRGFLYLFCNAHGLGYSLAQDPTMGKSYVYRSDHPYSIESFTLIHEDNFSYSQPWTTKRGLLWLHTRYADRARRQLFWCVSDNGASWSNPKMLAHIQMGNYQISGICGDTVATVFDHHATPVGLNARTNLYYLQTTEMGEAWTTVRGEVVKTPILSENTPALVRDYAEEGLLVYLKDLNFDSSGQPVILYLTTGHHAPGSEGNPRTWHTARWTGEQWDFRDLTTSDHNYDHGSLWIEPDGTWRVIAPTDPGPQAWFTGGSIVVWVSRNQGETWRREQTLGHWNGRNQTYVRRPLNAHDWFYAMWADGDAQQPSESDLYFATRTGEVYRLPREITGHSAQPIRIHSAS